MLARTLWGRLSRNSLFVSSYRTFAEIRLSHFMARCGVSSRRDAEKLILEGVVTVNGEKVTQLGTKVEESTAKVQVRGKEISNFGKTVLFMMNKVKGEIVSSKDPSGRMSVFDRLEKLRLSKELRSVGRLDINTEGLLLFTNNGYFARNLELPANEFVRRYRVRVRGKVTNKKLMALRRGIMLEGRKLKPIQVSVERTTKLGSNQWIQFECTEGKKHLVRKVCKSMHWDLSRLIRVGFGPYLIEGVAPGSVAALKIPESLRKFTKPLSRDKDRQRQVTRIVKNSHKMNKEDSESTPKTSSNASKTPKQKRPIIGRIKSNITKKASSSHA